MALRSADEVLSSKWRLKGCPHCGGDQALVIEDGFQSWDCIACGRSQELVKVRNIPDEEVEVIEDVVANMSSG